MAAVTDQACASPPQETLFSFFEPPEVLDVAAKNSHLQLQWHTGARYSRVQLLNLPGNVTHSNAVII